MEKNINEGKGFRVMGTNSEFFSRYKYRGGQSIRINKGYIFDDLYDVVLGAGVAEKLGYEIGTSLIVSNGLQSFSDHDDQPFKVSGILKKTGTPVDNTVIVSLAAIEAIHVDWSTGAKIPGQLTPIDEIRQMDLTPKNITAVLVVVKSKLTIFQLQRWINEYSEDAMTAILHGAAMQDLCGVVGFVENLLLGIQIQESNLFGYGKQLSTSVTVGGLSKNFSIDYSDPYFLDTNYTFGFKLFNNEYQYVCLLYTSPSPRD